jgi:hypothetical protein
MTAIIVSSLLLVIGSTVYRFRCPRRVQEFSETQYVEQLGHPRPRYISDALKREGQKTAAVTTLLGGGLALCLIVERLWLAGLYLYRYYWGGP